MARQAKKAAPKAKAPLKPVTKEAAERAINALGAAADAMTFAWQPVSTGPTENDKKFDATAQRIAKAIEELNAALKEASDNTEMRVELGRKGQAPAQLYHRIYRLTHSVFSYQVDVRLADRADATDWWKGKYAPVPKTEHDEGAERII